MKLLDVLKADEQKIENWFKSKEPAFIAAIKQSISISSAFLAWAKSPQGVAIETLIVNEIPQAKEWSADAIEIAEAMGKDMAVVTNPASWDGIALRLAAEILKLIDGGKLPSGIDGYLAEIQEVFIGS